MQNIDEAANDYVEKNFLQHTVWAQETKDAFKSGAEWMQRQMRSEERKSKKLLVCGVDPIPPEALIIAKEVGVELVALDDIRAKPEELINPVQKLEMCEIKMPEPISLNTLSIQDKCKQQPWRKRGKNCKR